MVRGEQPASQFDMLSQPLNTSQWTMIVVVFERFRKGAMPMMSVRRLFAAAAVAGLLMVLPGCHRTPTGQLGPFYIMLTYNNGNCQQNGSSSVIDVPMDQNVIYQGASSISQFNVVLASCPFASGNCPVNSPNGTPMNVGQPTSSAKDNTYTYTGLTINNQTCTDGGQMGVRIKPGP